MTILHTLKKRRSDVTAALKSALDKLSDDPGGDPGKFLFSLDSS